MSPPGHPKSESAAERGARPPAHVMSARRALAVVPNALSFPRATMRELVRGRWRIEKDRFCLDAEGRGEILYRVVGGGCVFHFFLISQKLPEEQKTDRNFAAGWDAMGVLCEGEWTVEREAHLRREVPKQRAGFADYDTLVYARGNRSARVFEHVVQSLAAGQQPDLRLIAPIGYILRTTAFIGNGQLGTKPLAGLAPAHPLRRPYHVQFCSAFALREFVFDLVDHMARARSPHAVRLAPAYRRYLGLGNAAATGLSAFVANHPHFMHCWSAACEDALALACARPMHGAAAAVFEALLAKATGHFAEGARDDDGVFVTPQAVAADLEAVRAAYARLRRDAPGATWSALAAWAQEHVGLDAAEVVNALVVELYPDLADRFADAFHADERFTLRPDASLPTLRDDVMRGYGWLLERADAADASYFWYRSTTAPRDVRRGLRGREPAREVETNMDTAFKVRALVAALEGAPAGATVADLVQAWPDLRHVVARVQSLAGCGYAELRDPWLARGFSPFGSLRLPLAFFGMEKFEAALPKSVRGTFLQGAPIAEDVAAGRDGDWPFPLLPGPATLADLASLDPLPPSLPFAAPMTIASDTRPLRRIAPNELARMVHTALQGHGAALGVAEDAAPLAVFAQATGAPGVAAVVRHCVDGLLAGRAATAAEAATATAPATDAPITAHVAPLVELDGGGRSSLQLAPIALDLACARAQTGVVRVTRVRHVRDAWLAASLVLRGAAQGTVALAWWQDARDTGFTLAGPGTPGPWFVRGTATTPAALGERLEQVAPHGGGVAAEVLGALARTIAKTVADDAPGFALAVVRPREHAAAAFVDVLARTGMADFSWAAGEPARREATWYREGIAVDRDAFDALMEAGRSVLMPPADETRVLPAGADPLKVF